MEELFHGEYIQLRGATVPGAAGDLTVRRIGLDRPAVRNALSLPMLRELERVLLSPDIRECGVLVLESSSADFCLGVDLTELAAESGAGQLSHLLGIERVLTLLGRLACLTIALVRGRAFGAGADLVVACDYRVGVGAAQLAFRGWRFGLALGTRRLVDRVGNSAATELLVSGRAVEAGAAKDCGLLTEVCAGAADADRFVSGVCGSLTEIPAPARRQLLELTRPPVRAASSQDLIESVRADGFSQNLARFRAGLRRSAR